VLADKPPYALDTEFVEQALRLVHSGAQVAMFLRPHFLEGQRRKSFFATYPLVVVSSSRIKCAKDGDFNSLRKTTNAVAYAWFLCEEGFVGETILRWFN